MHRQQRPDGVELAPECSGAANPWTSADFGFADDTSGGKEVDHCRRQLTTLITTLLSFFLFLFILNLPSAITQFCFEPLPLF